MGDPHRAEFPLARRVVGVVMCNLPFILGAPALGLAAGGAAAWLEPRPFEDRAVLQVGLRFLKTPIEPPYEVRERVSDALTRAEAYRPGVELGVLLRRREKTNLPAQGVDVVVRAEDPDVARAVLDQGLSQVLAAHAAYHEEAVEAARLPVEGLREVARRIEASRALAAGSEAAVAALDAQMAKTDRLRWGSEEVLARVREAPTEVLARAPAPTRVPSRGPTWALGGLLTGLLLGLSVALLRGEW